MLSIRPNMQVHDELAALFTRNLTLDPDSRPAPPKEQLQPQAQPQAAAPPAAGNGAPVITYSVSQHYHHSSHLARPVEPALASQHLQEQQQQQQQQQPRPASAPVDPERERVSAVLAAHGVDASALSASQLSLFRAAEDGQKQRLVELWRIFPPASRDANPATAWGMTTLEQEEGLARLRFEHAMAEEHRCAEVQNQAQTMAEAPPPPAPVLSLDGTLLTPMQGGDGRWGGSASAVSSEPYITNGYEELARREYEDSIRRQYESALSAAAAAAAAAQAQRDMERAAAAAAAAHSLTQQLVPVGIHHNGYNQATDPAYKSMAMENQYGYFEQLRAAQQVCGRDEMEIL